MTVTPREIMYRTLSFDAPPRAARQMWLLPWAQHHYPEHVERLAQRFPADIVNVPVTYHQPSPAKGDPYACGTFTDEWGCVFTNLQQGIIGEVREPLIPDWECGWSHVHFPREWLSFDVDDVNRECGKMDVFVLGNVCPRPFEQMQFFRTTQLLYVDLLEQPEQMLEFMRHLHNFYCEVMEKWAKTDVDALMFMDDWGSQHSLLINPQLWRELFRPMYQDYIQIAHAANKKIFMHSDGYILDIYPDLVELGLDAINSQVFCMGPEALAPYAGKITFWGEVDRQNLLPYGTRDDIAEAVRLLHKHLWRNGGCIAQCEFGIGAKPENVEQVFETWQQLTTA